MRPEDDDLRERFAALREHEAQRAPGFRALRTRAGAPERPRRRATWIWAPALAGGLAAAAAVWLVLTPAPRPSTPATPAFQAGEWAMPTDVLLDLSGLPGDDLLRELPSLGTVPGPSIEGARNETTDRRFAA